jgi:sugar diacid utilization regulator
VWLFVTAFVYFFKFPNANCSATPLSLHVNHLQRLEKIKEIFGLLEPKNETKNTRGEVGDYLQVNKASNPR